MKAVFMTLLNKKSSEIINVYLKGIKFGDSTPLSILFNVSSQYLKEDNPVAALQMLVYLRGCVSRKMNSEISEDRKNDYINNLFFESYSSKNQFLCPIEKVELPFIDYLISKTHLEILNRNLEEIPTKSQQEVLIEITKNPLLEKIDNFPYSLFSLEIYHYRIYSLLQMNKPRQALEQCNLSLEFYKEEITILSYKVDALLQLNFVDESLHSCEILELEINKSLFNKKGKQDDLLSLKSQTLNNHALLDICKENYHSAQNNLLLALQIEPNSLEYNFNYSIVLLKMNKQVDSCIFWFKFRNFLLEENTLYYEKLISQISFQIVELDYKIKDNVTCSVSKSQSLLLDFHLLSLWKNRVDKEDTLKQKETPKVIDLTI